MSKQPLIENEFILNQIKDDTLILTTHRLILKEIDGWTTKKHHIPLENISSINSNYTQKTSLLYVSIFFIIIGILLPEKIAFIKISDLNTLLFIAAGIFFVLFFWSQKKTLNFYSDCGQKIQLSISGVKYDDIDIMVNHVINAKNKRLYQLKNII